MVALSFGCIKPSARAGRRSLSSLFQAFALRSVCLTRQGYLSHVGLEARGHTLAWCPRTRSPYSILQLAPLKICFYDQLTQSLLLPLHLPSCQLSVLPVLVTVRGSLVFLKASAPGVRGLHEESSLLYFLQCHLLSHRVAQKSLTRFI